MKNSFILFLLLFIFSGCDRRGTVYDTKTTHPSHSYCYATVDEEALAYRESDYVPVYSDIYDRDGTKRFLLTTTISIRNTSRDDSAYILRALYYDSYGSMLKAYIDSTVLLRPLESIEFVVEEVEDLGGAGANFIVDWGAMRNNRQVLIQSVMIGTYAGQGVSFLSEARIISSEEVRIE